MGSLSVKRGKSFLLLFALLKTWEKKSDGRKLIYVASCKGDRGNSLS
jgi:hypothetical protein